jgi:hypothetical protein
MNRRIANLRMRVHALRRGRAASQVRYPGDLHEEITASARVRKVSPGRTASLLSPSAMKSKRIHVKFRSRGEPRGSLPSQDANWQLHRIEGLGENSCRD